MSLLLGLEHFKKQGRVKNFLEFRLDPNLGFRLEAGTKLNKYLLMEIKSSNKKFEFRVSFALLSQFGFS